MIKLPDDDLFKNLSPEEEEYWLEMCRVLRNDRIKIVSLGIAFVVFATLFLVELFL